MGIPYEHELTVALDAVLQAGSRILEEYARFQVIADAPATISTHADRLAQNIILDRLHAAFPADGFCAEESTDQTSEVSETSEVFPPRVWIVDPIDGTRGFARKNDEFSIMVALVEEKRIAAGVVFEPAKARLTYATQNGGCWKRDGGVREGEAATPAYPAEPTSCHVSACQELAQATLVQSHSRNPDKPSARVKALQPARIVETYSAGIKLAMVARGEADIYLNTYSEFHDWDICAGHILVHESGGRVTGLGGQELHYGLPGAWQRHGVLASNGRLHAAAVQALASIPSDE